MVDHPDALTHSVDIVKDYAEKAGLELKPEVEAVGREACDALVGGWQPIETAPKDGTEILTYMYGKHSIIHWRGCWADDEGFGIETPTHWMPLPELPK